MESTIKSIEISHKCPFSDDYVMNIMKMLRMVVWAMMERGERVWIRTVEGDLEHTYNEVKIAFFQEFFNGLVGQTIEFEPGKHGGFFVNSYSVPLKFSKPSYPRIKHEMEKWVEENCAELIKRLNKEKAAKAAATRIMNREYAEEMEEDRRRDIQEYGLRDNATDEEIYNARHKKYLEECVEKERRKLEEKRRNALKLTFRKGINRKYGTEQWETKKNGVIYVLDRRDSYESAQGEVPVEKVRELVLGRIVLVKQI